MQISCDIFFLFPLSQIMIKNLSSVLYPSLSYSQVYDVMDGIFNE